MLLALLELQDLNPQPKGGLITQACYIVCYRLFQIVFLVVGLAMFTTVIPEAMMLLGTRKKFGGSYKNERGKTFIVVSNTQTLILYKDRILRTVYV